MLIWRVRDIVDIVHVLMNVEMTVTFFMEGAHNFLLIGFLWRVRLILHLTSLMEGATHFSIRFLMEGVTLFKFSPTIYGGCACYFNIGKIFSASIKSFFRFRRFS